MLLEKEVKIGQVVYEADEKYIFSRKITRIEIDEMNNIHLYYKGYNDEWEQINKKIDTNKCYLTIEEAKQALIDDYLARIEYIKKMEVT